MRAARIDASDSTSASADQGVADDMEIGGAVTLAARAGVRTAGLRDPKLAAAGDLGAAEFFSRV